MTQDSRLIKLIHKNNNAIVIN